MKRLVTLAFVVLICGCASAGKPGYVIDDFEYRNVDSARARWQVSDGAGPVELVPGRSGGAKTALKVPCHFTRDDVDAAVCELPVSLDLTGFGGIEFDLYLANPTLLRAFRVDLKSGDGMYRYRQWYEVKSQAGWTHVKLDKGNFKAKGKPAGWQQIDAIRISASRDGRGETFFLLDNLRADTSKAQIALIRSGDERTNWKLEMRHSIIIRDYIGLGMDRIVDGDVEKGRLVGYKVAIFPRSPNMSEAMIGRITEFVQAGGKIVVFDPMPPQILALLGVNKTIPMSGSFKKVRFETDQLTKLPETMELGASDAVVPAEMADTTHVIARWQDKDGKLDRPAIVMNDNGVFVGRMLWPQQRTSEIKFMLSILEHFIPGLQPWSKMADRALARAAQIGHSPDRTALEKFLKTNVKDQADRDEVAKSLSAARAVERLARAAAESGDYDEMVKQAELTRPHLVDAYVLAHQPRVGEMRGVWIGVRESDKPAEGYTWDDACRVLAENNFNAIFPNMLNAGVARYQSKLLPMRGVKRYGDQLAQCIKAARKYGLQVHVWKINYNMEGSPGEFRKKIKAQGRASITYKGEFAEHSGSLCPSHPENLKLEVETMLEVAKNYDIDGLHFDYIRYQDDTTCYCDGCRERFEAYRKSKVTNWPDDCWSGPLRQEYRDWRCLQISKLVKTVSERARKIKPGIKISGAVYGGYPACKESVGQDWVLWAKQGWVDFLCPMDYAEGDAFFTGLVASQVALVDGTVPIYAGIGNWMFDRDRPDRVVGQVELAREFGADGFVMFPLRRDFVKYTLPALSTLTASKTIMPHDGPQIEFEVVDRDRFEVWPPALICSDDGLKIRVWLRSPGRFKDQVVAYKGVIELQDMVGETLDVIKDMLPGPGSYSMIELPRRQGSFRLAAVGEVTFKDGTERAFIRRSQPYRFAEPK